MHKRAALVVLAAAVALIVVLMGASGALATSKPPYGIKPTPKPKPKPKPKSSRYNVTTKVAIAINENAIYRRPTTKSDVVKQLAFYTPDGEALQTYRFVKSRRVGRTQWELIDVPARPNGQSGWVKRSWLGAARISHTLVLVDIDARTVIVYKHGKQVFSTPAGVGKPTTPTPTGHFWVAEAFPSQNPFYGPWAFGTTDYAADTEFPDGSIVGLHGTDAPELIPGDPSHGCIRFKDADILQMKKFVSIGSAVWIEYSPALS
ncbi:MAG TPA: L,D-transpeptidase [Solirubrobacteraceae bacterium]|nr:L,D-transpeptidase [Solirubrobacteraceae bacterium]